MVRATPDTRVAREAFAAKLREVRGIEHTNQIGLHELRRKLGRPLQRNDVSTSMLDIEEGPVDAAQEAGMVVLGGDLDKVNGILTRAFRLEKAKVDRETGIDTLK